jgi:hypothetical protein
VWARRAEFGYAVEALEVDEAIRQAQQTTTQAKPEPETVAPSKRKGEGQKTMA